jgi:RimJ/RimL family protein N-acetyltransferase
LTRTQRPFYAGENINLVVPTLDHVANSSWSDWFNSQQTSRHTSHAILANTVEDQQAFFTSMKTTGRFALLITPADDPTPIGVVSLSGVDFRQGTAAVAIVMDTESQLAVSPFASLEAMALITRHAFDVMGLRRVEAGQAYPALLRWTRLLELLGYRAEGFKRESFARGREVSDVVVLGCLYETYRRLADERDGAFWPGSSKVSKLMLELPRPSFAELLDTTTRGLEAKYFGQDGQDGE